VAAAGLALLRAELVPFGRRRRTLSRHPGAAEYAYTLVGANLSDDGAAFAITVRGGDSADGSETVGTAQALLSVSNTPPVVFQDGEFLPEDWSAEGVARPAQEPPPAHGEERVETGGNPGTFHRTTPGMPSGPWTCLDFSAGAPPLRLGYAHFVNWPGRRHRLPRVWTTAKCVASLAELVS
jgi:hypothetical protein